MNGVKKDAGGPTLTFVFSMLALFFGLYFLGYLNQNAGIIIYLVQIAVWPTYFVGALRAMDNGDGLGGNTFFYFSAYFTIVPGITGVFTYFADRLGWPYDPKVMGLVWLCLGVLLGGTLPAYKQANKVFFSIVSTATAALIVFGLGSLGFVPAGFMSPWCGVIYTYIGIAGIYLSIDGMLNYVGIELPKGKPFFKIKPVISGKTRN